MIGARYLGGGRCSFTVWPPRAKQVSVSIVDAKTIQAMQPTQSRYWTLECGAEAGSRYFYRLDDQPQRPDPASHFQPEGVHGPSQIVDHTAFQWTDSDWNGPRQEQMIFYEIHVGTFTPEGTFDGVIERLTALRDLGITAVELMPVAQFPQERNWGYDGVYPFAVQASYGGPDGLKRLVDACHGHGLAVTLDVVYNHFGPEGNYLRQFGPYFTNKYNTPWGEAINFDDAYSDPVRQFFIGNALYWFQHYHIDALRLDALHQIYDQSARPFLRELADATRRFGAEHQKCCWLFGECELNDVRLVEPAERGGCGLDGLWCDDFHHALHVLLTGKRTGYYADYDGIDQMVKALQEGYVYSWDYSHVRRRHYGSCNSVGQQASAAESGAPIRVHGSNAAVYERPDGGLS
ncbi:MAG: hypothetical protein LLF76_08045 [Planctomycetaceae bacterium]|nr:hypothetical protein [Planctomycetaceae bacterium]